MASDSCPECTQNSTDWEEKPIRNTTSEDYAYDYEEFENVEYMLNYDKLFQAYLYGIPIQILFGSFFNILGLVFIIRCRMWRKHEGYIYVVTIFINNIIYLAIIVFPFWISLFQHVNHIRSKSTLLCKLWSFFVHIIQSAGWVVVALLVNVYLRQHLTRNTNGNCWNFASKYCTPFGTKLVIGLFFVSSALLNLWHIPSTKLHNIQDDDDFCYHDMNWYIDLRWWRMTTRFISRDLSVVILTPILCLMILCSSSKRSSALQFTYSEEERGEVRIGEVQLNNAETKDFKKASLVLAATVFIPLFPLLFIEAISELGVHSKNLWLAFIASEYITIMHLFLPPLPFLLLIIEFREAIRSLFISSPCNVGNCCRNWSPNDAVNAVLPLGFIQQRSPVEY